jgi:inverse autotransporter-like protein with beta domain
VALAVGRGNHHTWDALAMGRASDLARRAGSALLATALVPLASWGVAAEPLWGAEEEEGLPPAAAEALPPAAPNTWYTRGAVAALRALDQKRALSHEEEEPDLQADLQVAGVAALNSAIADAVARLATLNPDRLGRSQLDLRLSEEWRTGYDLLTVQPLYRSPSGQDTVVVEGRLAHGAGSELTTGNAAVGYRRLVHGDHVLLGASCFYDHQWPYDERRLGVESRGPLIDPEPFAFDDVSALSLDRLRR